MRRVCDAFAWLRQIADGDFAVGAGRFGFVSGESGAAGDYVLDVRFVSECSGGREAANEIHFFEIFIGVAPGFLG